MSNIPTGYQAFVAQQQGTAFAQKLMAGFGMASKTSLRLNPAKAITLPYPSVPVPWCPQGHALNERPNFALDPLWHAGAYYVQEAGSMAVGEVVRSLAPTNSRLALDLCAAPGGKSTHLLNTLPQGCLLVANELIRARVARLQENLERWGNPCHISTNLDPDFIGQRTAGLWDIVVVDAPCSGEGLFRKDSNAASEWSPAHVDFCASRQQRILADIWPALKPGGLLVYSTCTLNTTEDEGVVQFVCDTLCGKLLPLPASVAAYGTASAQYPEAIRLLPDGQGTEGQFLAAFCKPGIWAEPEPTPSTKKETDKLVAPSLPHVQAVQACAPEIAKQDLFFFNEGIHLLPSTLRAAAREVLLQLPVVAVGAHLGQCIGKNLAFSQGMATLAGYKLAAPTVALSLPEALLYLKKAELRDVLTLEPGVHLATYAGAALGWLKAIQGGRINNLLPTARRIRLDLPQAIRDEF